MQPLSSHVLYPMALSVVDKMQGIVDTFPEKSIISKFKFKLKATVNKCPQSCDATTSRTDQLTVKIPISFKESYSTGSEAINPYGDESRRARFLTYLIEQESQSDSDSDSDSEDSNPFRTIHIAGPDYTSHPLFPFLLTLVIHCPLEENLKREVTNCFRKYIMQGFASIAAKTSKGDTFTIDRIKLKVAYIESNGRSGGSTKISNISDIIRQYSPSSKL